MRNAPILLALWFVTGGSTALAQDVPQAFVGARLIPMAGPEIPDGVVVVHEGRIVAVGPASSTQIPAGAQRHDTSGTTMMPGLVDTHSHIGSPEGGDRSGPLHPDVRVLDSINVRDARLQNVDRNLAN